MIFLTISYDLCTIQLEPSIARAALLVLTRDEMIGVDFCKKYFTEF